VAINIYQHYVKNCFDLIVKLWKDGGIIPMRVHQLFETTVKFLVLVISMP
jgi:hypothetical protein